MKLGDRIRLRIERQSLFSDEKPEITEGEYIVIGVSYGAAHCFSKDSWSPGFNSFEYGEHQDGRPDVVRLGTIYVPTPSFLDKQTVDGLHHDKKVVSWEILDDNPDYTIPGFENLEDSLDKLSIRRTK